MTIQRAIYTEPENWYGSYYELAIELQTVHDNAYLLQALQTLWGCSALSGGPWLEKNDYGQSPMALPYHVLEIEPFKRLYGVLSIPELENPIGCLSVLVREEKGSDWLDFCIPTGMLSKVFPVKYPLFRDANSWLGILDSIFLRIADTIYQRTPYDLALIGEEVSGYMNKVELTVEELQKGGYLLSPYLWNNLSTQSEHETLPSGLLWIAPSK